MKRFASLALLAAVALIGGCGGDTHESLMGENLSAMKEMTAILESVKDEASAKAAAAKIDALSTRMQDLTKRMSAMPEPTKEQMEAMAKKYDKELADVMKKMVEASMKAAMTPGAQAHLDAAMNKFDKAKGASK